MKLPVDYIRMFDTLDAALVESGDDSKEWAAHSGLPASRLSELRKLSSEYKVSGNAINIGRALSEKKINMLLSGLISLIGVKMVTKSLRKALKNATTQDERIFIMMMIAKSEDAGQLEKALELITAEKAKPAK